MEKVSAANTQNLTADQLEIINGSLLGDGRIDKNGNGRFIKSQSENKKEYLQWHFEKLKPFSNGISLEKVYKIRNQNGNIINDRKEIAGNRCVFYTCNHPVFKELRKIWYPQGKKTIPTNLKLSPLSIAIWFVDDGSNNPKYKDLKISTESFSFESIEFLISLLKEYAIVSYPVKARNNHHVIRISNYSYLDFINLINPFVVWDCFNYKVSLDEFINSSRLTLSQVQNIKLDIINGLTVNEIQKKHNINKQKVIDIKYHRTWSWV